MKQNHGWGRRQLLQRARRELRGKGDDDDSHGGGLGHGGFRRRSRDATIPLSFTTLTRSGYSVNQGVRNLLRYTVNNAFLNAHPCTIPWHSFQLPHQGGGCMTHAPLPPSHWPPDMSDTPMWQVLADAPLCPLQDAPLGSLIAEDGSPIDLQLKRGGPFGKIQDPAVSNFTSRPGFRSSLSWLCLSCRSGRNTASMQIARRATMCFTGTGLANLCSLGHSHL